MRSSTASPVVPDPANTPANRETFRGLSQRRRGRTGLTRCDLAARLCGGRRTAQAWEAGVNHPGAERLEALTEVRIEIFRARANVIGAVHGRRPASPDYSPASQPRDAPSPETELSRILAHKALLNSATRPRQGSMNNPG